MAGNLYSQTPASNDIANYFQTGMLPSKVKNAGWDIMADIATWMGLPTSGGTANAQTITNTNQYTALVAGLVRGIFVPGNTNTGAATLQIDGLTAKNCFANGVAVIAGMIVSGVPCHYVYDGTNITILNPQRSTGSFTITLTGMTATITGTVNYSILPDGKTFSVWVASTITGTSNAATMTGTGVPAILTNTTSKRYPITVRDNGSTISTWGVVETGTSTTWTFGTTTNLNGFTGSGAKGLPVEAAFVGSID